MTKLEALTNSRDMWVWLAQHPKKSKQDYFTYIKLSSYFRPENNCYLCEYTQPSSKPIPTACNTCPLTGKWVPGIYGFASCELQGSPYWQWFVESNNPIWAWRIVQLLNTEINNLSGFSYQV